MQTSNISVNGKRTQKRKDYPIVCVNVGVDTIHGSTGKLLDPILHETFTFDPLSISHKIIDVFSVVFTYKKKIYLLDRTHKKRSVVQN